MSYMSQTYETNQGSSSLKPPDLKPALRLFEESISKTCCSVEDETALIIFDLPIILSSVKPASFFNENGPFGFDIIFLINFFFFFLFYCNFW